MAGDCSSCQLTLRTYWPLVGSLLYLIDNWHCNTLTETVVIRAEVHRKAIGAIITVVWLSPVKVPSMWPPLIFYSSITWWKRWWWCGAPKEGEGKENQLSNRCGRSSGHHHHHNHLKISTFLLFHLLLIYDHLHSIPCAFAGKVRGNVRKSGASSGDTSHWLPNFNPFHITRALVT